MRTSWRDAEEPNEPFPRNWRTEAAQQYWSQYGGVILADWSRLQAVWTQLVESYSNTKRLPAIDAVVRWTQSPLTSSSLSEAHELSVHTATHSFGNRGKEAFIRFAQFRCLNDIPPSLLPAAHALLLSHLPPSSASVRDNSACVGGAHGREGTLSEG